MKNIKASIFKILLFYVMGTLIPCAASEIDRNLAVDLINVHRLKTGLISEKCVTEYRVKGDAKVWRGICSPYSYLLNTLNTKNSVEVIKKPNGYVVKLSQVSGKSIEYLFSANLEKIVEYKTTKGTVAEYFDYKSFSQQKYADSFRLTKSNGQITDYQVLSVNLSGEDETARLKKSFARFSENMEMSFEAEAAVVTTEELVKPQDTRKTVAETQDSTSSLIPKSRRVALVIGNSDYEVNKLKNAVNDANAIANTLETKLGFEVLKLTNVDRKELYKAVQEFRETLDADDIALFFYSGHGVEVAGKNYLLPVDNATIRTQEDVPIEAISANDVLRQMEASGSQLNVMILDACRNNPLPSAVRSVSRGLSMIDAQQGSIIVYATKPGQVAYDGFGSHSPFTEALLTYLPIPNQSVTELFNSVGLAVSKSTNQQQIPWVSSSPVPRISLADK